MVVITKRWGLAIGIGDRGWGMKKTKMNSLEVLFYLVLFRVRTVPSKVKDCQRPPIAFKQKRIITSHSSNHDIQSLLFTNKMNYDNYFHSNKPSRKKVLHVTRMTLIINLNRLKTGSLRMPKLIVHIIDVEMKWEVTPRMSTSCLISHSMVKPYFIHNCLPT